MIKLILSDRGKTNSHYLYKKIENRLDQRKKSILIVPEQYTLETDINFLEAIKYKAVMDAKVLSFSSFASFFMENFLEEKIEFLNREGKLILLTNILKDLNDDLVLFKNSYQNIDFIDSLVSLISSFKDNNFDETFFENILSSDISEISKDKFEELKLIIFHYQKEIDGKYLDKEDILLYVSQNIEKTDYLKDYEFFIDKFDFFEDRKIDLIRVLDHKGIDINISLNIDPIYIKDPHLRPEIFDTTKRTFDKFREEFETSIEVLNPTKDNTELGHLKDNFEKYRISPFEGKVENIKVYESISTKSEVENMAILINKFIKANENIRYKDMAVYLTNTEEYENELIKTFSRYEIPIFLDKRRKMADNHIIKTILALLRLRVNSYRPEDLFYILNSKLLSIKEEDANALINFLNYRKIKGTMFENDKFFELDYDFYVKNLADDPKREEKLVKKKLEYERVNRVRDKILLLTKDLSREEKEVKTTATAIYNMVANPDFMAGINSFQDKLLENKSLDDYKENEQIWDEFMAILDQLVLLMGDRKLSLIRIYSLIESVCKDVQIGLIPPSKDHLTVTDFARDRVSNKKINIVLGMDDAYFPSNEVKDYIISPDEVEELSQKDIDLKLYSQDREPIELLNLYKIIADSEKLIISYALSDKEGKELKESFLIRDILRIFPKLSKKTILATSLDDAVLNQESLKKYTLNILNRLVNNENINEDEKSLALAYMAYLREKEEDSPSKKTYDKIRKGLFYTNDKNHLPLEIRQRLYNKNAFSVSEIETYSACPYKHFIAYGLRPDVDKVFDLDALDIGNIVHKSFEDLSRLIKEENLENLTSDKLNELLDKNFEEGIDLNLDEARKTNPKNKYILKNINQAAKRNAKEIVNQLEKGEFRLSNFEEDFDRNGLFKPVYVDDQNYLRGRIDRIDRAGNMLRVIDYKTGNKAFNLLSILNGKDLQLIVYLIAIDDDPQNYEPIGAFYISLSDEIESLKDSITDEKKIESMLDKKFALDGLLIDKDGRALRLMDRDSNGKTSSIVRRRTNYKIDEKDFKNLSKFVKTFVKDIIKDIKDGKIDLAPLRENKSYSACTFCDYKGICKFDKTIDTTRFRDFDNSLSLKDLEDSND